MELIKRIIFKNKILEQTHKQQLWYIVNILPNGFFFFKDDYCNCFVKKKQQTKTTTTTTKKQTPKPLNNKTCKDRKDGGDNIPSLAVYSLSSITRARPKSAILHMSDSETRTFAARRSR